MREINGHAERSGKKVMYAFNVTGEIDEMKRRHDLVASYGGNCMFSSGQWAGQAFDTYSALGSADLIHAAGGGIMAHPGGIAAGVASIRQAWEAALSGQTLAQASGRYDALRQAMEKFAP